MPTPSDWGINETRLFDDMGYAVPGLENDRMAQALYDTALYNFDINTRDRHAVIEALRNYMQSNYGVDFDSVFSWDGYREAYDRGQG